MSLPPRSPAHFKTYWIAYAVLLLSLCLTCVAYFGHARYIDDRDQARFAQEGQAAFEQVEAQLHVFVMMMKGIRAMYSANPGLTPQDLERYFRVLRIEDLQLDKGLEGVGVIYAVPPENRVEHETALRRTRPDYRLNTKRTNAMAFPLIYLERLGRGTQATPMGWDVGQDPIRREALERALASGQPAVTAKTELFYSDRTNGARGFIIYLPFFQRIEDEGQTRWNVRGFVLAAFDAQKLWNNLFGYQHPSLGMEVYDGESFNPEALLFGRAASADSRPGTVPRFQGTISATFFGRRWTFLFSSNPQPSTFFEYYLPKTLFILGIAGSFLLFRFVSFQASSRAAAEHLTRTLQESELSVRQANEELARKVEEAERTSRESRMAQARLAVEKERLTVTLRSIDDAVVATDSEGLIQLMNRVAEQVSERISTQAAGHVIDAVFPLLDAQTRAPRKTDLSHLGVRKPTESGKAFLFAAPSGRELLLHRRVAPIHDESGQITGAVFVFRDVTQERKIEEELVRASKLDSIGLLAGGIAHDFNNVLTGIVGNLSLLRDTPGLPVEVADRLALLERTAYKARQLTLQLLTFAKGGSPIKQTASVPEVIRESAEFALRGSNVSAEFVFPSELRQVEIDSGQISQVIQNLVINAKQAMPEGGAIYISAMNTRLDSAVNLPLPEGEYVRVSIRDTGTGIKPEHLNKIFDPYFTTKPSGTGLGLATAYSIMKRHDGLITVESEAGKGSLFHLYLPASNKSLASLEPENVAAVRGEGRILVMDDEASIRTLLTSILAHFGYSSHAVRNGEEAVREYERALQAKEPYSAVIMDLTVPGGMGGKDAVKELLRIDPGARAIVSSGYSNDPVLANFREYGFVARVEKPYRLSELAAVLANVLKPAGGAAAVAA